MLKIRLFEIPQISELSELHQCNENFVIFCHFFYIVKLSINFAKNSNFLFWKEFTIFLFLFVISEKRESIISSLLQAQIIEPQKVVKLFPLAKIVLAKQFSLLDLPCCGKDD